MFNFKELKLDRRESSENTNSFVGIRKNSNNEIEFRLPRGFDDFPENNFEVTKNLFFKMYRTFKKFEQDNTSLQLDNRVTGKDNIEKSSNGYQFKDKENNDVIIYSKISVIENLLEAYQDLSIDVIERQSGRNEEIDYSKIDRYLHKSTYLEDDVIYIDEMELPRHYLQYKSSTLIDLFCFILYELYIELEQDTDERVKDLANRFKEQYLSYDHSIFSEETFESTISILKDILDDVDKITAYKDENYWKIYEAIETFLYGELDMKNAHEDGVFWGISNFYQIWEDMCNTYSFATFDDIVYSDTNIIFNGSRVANYTIGGHKLFKKNEFKNNFFIEFRDKKRWMRPDLIRHETAKSYRDNININIKKENSQYIDFTIHSRDKELLKVFCSNIKLSIKNKHFPSRPIKGNEFKNYPRHELEKRLDYKILKDSKDTMKVLDWKYIDLSTFKSKNKKVDTDINKQLCYEYSIQQGESYIKIESQFVIPYFYNVGLEPKDEIGFFADKYLLSEKLNDNKIKVFKANFKKIQEVYLTHD